MPKQNQTPPKKNTKKKLLLFFIIILIIAILSVGIYLSFYLKKNMLVKAILFSGNQHLKEEELHGLIKVKKGDPLYAISLSQIHKNLKHSPWIKDAMIRKEVNGAILIKITENFPLAILLKAGKLYLIDNDGVILEEILGDPVIFLPTIIEIHPNNNLDAYREALAFIRVINEKKLLAYSRQLEITGKTPDELAIKVDDLLIKIGFGDYEKKLQRLQKIEDEIKNKNIVIDYIDLRFSEQVIVKPRNH